MKIATVVGARPQFVKMGPLSRLFKNKVEEVVIHTGQHYDDNLSGIFFKELSLGRPKYNLGVKVASPVSQIALMLTGLNKVLSKETPDLVLTYGDTNSTLATALASVKLGFPLAHVEAGVRSFDLSVPEEANRLITDRLSALLFCPTERAVENLKKEGLKRGVFYTGDVMAEVLGENINKAEKNSAILKSLGIKESEYILVTLHRQETVEKEEKLAEIVRALSNFKGRLVFPVHPRTRNNLKRFKLWPKLNKSSSLILLEPQGYLDFLKLGKNAAKILTDSGGVQKEAYLLRVPCLTLRASTEWPETVESGWNRLVKCDHREILKALEKRGRPASHSNFFGNGRPSEKIFKLILSLCPGKT